MLRPTSLSYLRIGEGYLPERTAERTANPPGKHRREERHAPPHLLEIHRLTAPALPPLQTYAYVYDPKIDWGFREGQKAVGYLIAHLDHLGPVVVNALWAALLAGALVLLVSTLHSVLQMFRGGAVTSLAALHAMRILASLYATVLLFPTLNSLVLPLVARTGLAFYFSPTSAVVRVQLQQWCPAHSYACAHSLFPLL